MSEAKEYQVNHDKQYLAVGGKLQKFKKGDRIVLESGVAESLLKRNRLVEVSTGEAVSVGSALPAEESAPEVEVKKIPDGIPMPGGAPQPPQAKGRKKA